RLAAAGVRVLVPRWPEHGVANTTAEPDPVGAQDVAELGIGTTRLDRRPGHGVANTTAEPDPVGAQDVADFGMRTNAIALGLDKRTGVGGFSGGATLALWAAEHNAGVQRVVALAPCLGPVAVPPVLAHATANGMRLLPSVDVWWDVSRKEESQAPRDHYGKLATGRRA